MRQELGLMVTTLSMLCTLDVLHNRPTQTDIESPRIDLIEGLAILPEPIQIPKPSMIERKRGRNGHLPEGIDLGLLNRKVLLFPETR